ncbi:hypothetical protein H0H81_007562, partial [Sphagnurus paluster]
HAVDEPDDEETISGSPVKSLASSKATKSTVAQKISLKSVTPRSIAYIAVMLHFALTDASSWKSQYDGMDYKLLYNFIVDYFEDTPAPADQARIEALLKWWNEKTFPQHALALAAASTSMAKLREQRARAAAQQAQAL